MFAEREYLLESELIERCRYHCFTQSEIDFLKLGLLDRGYLVDRFNQFEMI